MLKNPRCLLPRAENLFYPPRKGDYVYFEMPHFEPGEEEIVEAAWAADAAMLAYGRYLSDRMPEAEFREILDDAGYFNVETIGDFFADNVNGGRGFFAWNESHALLAFRGTEAGNGHDMDADLGVFPADEAGVRVHGGFQRYLNSVWPRVRELIGEYRQGHAAQEICITGHSLGAAMATLAFTRLNEDTATSLFTFGCPRVGDAKYCDRVMKAARKRRCYRVVDYLDVVTHVPPWPIYQHPVVTEFWLDSDGGLVTNPEKRPGDWENVANMARGFVDRHWSKGLPEPLPRALADHSPVRYCHWVGAAAGFSTEEHDGTHEVEGAES